MLQSHSRKSRSFVSGLEGFKLALLTPSELGRWDFLISFTHQLHFAGEAVALFLIAWDTLFPPGKSSKELVQEFPKRSAKGLNNLGDS